jgi:hypothetical protein
MDAASSFANRYNTEVARLLQERGFSKCSEGVDWDAALHQLTSYVWSLSDDISKRGQVGAISKNNQDRPDFVVLLHEETTAGLELGLCRSLAADLPDETVRIELKSGQTRKKIKTIQCKNGKMTAATFSSAVTAWTRRTAIARCCASCSKSVPRNWRIDRSTG